MNEYFIKIIDDLRGNVDKLSDLGGVNDKEEIQSVHDQEQSRKCSHQEHQPASCQPVSSKMLFQKRTSMTQATPQAATEQLQHALLIDFCRCVMGVAVPNPPVLAQQHHEK